jgi:Flp pilus assembly pilin Flp
MQRSFRFVRATCIVRGLRWGHVQWLRLRPRVPAEAGQTTAEYALVIIGAAVIAAALAQWASGGAISGLFEKVLSKITSF